ncbi:MAG: hypothetical protein ACE5F2_01830 [Candidatus Paceibacteria bacterium]
MNTVIISKEIKKDLKSASHNLGISENALLKKAVSYYLHTIKKKVELKEELELWSKISEEDTAKFEKSI